MLLIWLHCKRLRIKIYLSSFIMNEGTPEEVLSKIFRVFDVNGDGSITLKEMTKLIKVS